MTNVMLKPMTISQKVQRPSDSDIMRPLIFGKPILDGADDREDDGADGDKVEMCDEEVAVLSLPIECHAGMAYSGDSGDRGIG